MRALVDGCAAINEAQGSHLLQACVVRFDSYQRMVLLRRRHRQARVQSREERQDDAVAGRHQGERAHVDLRRCC